MHKFFLKFPHDSKICTDAVLFNLMVSITIGIAQDGVDYDFPKHNFTISQVYNFTVSPGERHCFEIDIIDNSVADIDYKLVVFTVGELNPFDICGHVHIFIEDHEGKVGMLTKFKLC